MNQTSDSERIDTLFATLTSRWQEFPAAQAEELRALLKEALQKAQEQAPEVITVAGTTTRPKVLRLAVLATCSTDDYYKQEWAEFAIAAEGGAWVVYRRRDGQDYAAPWSQGSALPERMMQSMDPCLVMAIYGGDGGAN